MMAVLMGFIIDELRVSVTKKTLLKYMKRHHFVYHIAEPRENARMEVKAHEVEGYYNALTTQLNGVHAGLVCNMDEMGVEMFADKKDVKVFVRPEAVPPSGNLHVGVPRTSKRCTLVACISLDGETVTPTIIKTKNINSRLFDHGYSFENSEYL